MSTCSNCKKKFVQKTGGYYRFSLEKKLPKSEETARDVLSKLTGVPFTPVSNKRLGQFLCPACWHKLNDTVQYQDSLAEFWGKTQPRTYIGEKKTLSSCTVPRRPRYTSTPITVSRQTLINAYHIEKMNKNYHNHTNANQRTIKVKQPALSYTS